MTSAADLARIDCLTVDGLPDPLADWTEFDEGEKAFTERLHPRDRHGRWAHAAGASDRIAGLVKLHRRFLNRDPSLPFVPRPLPAERHGLRPVSDTTLFADLHRGDLFAQATTGSEAPPVYRVEGVGSVSGWATPVDGGESRNFNRRAQIGWLLRAGETPAPPPPVPPTPDPRPAWQMTFDEFAADPATMWHGTKWGTMGGGDRPLIHLGDWTTSHQALAANIAGMHPGERPTIEHDTAEMIPVRIAGPMASTTGRDFLGDHGRSEGASSEGKLRGILSRGQKPTQGYYYINEGEGVREIRGRLVYPRSAVVPSRDWLKTHEDFVREALAAGEDVPAGVLADYPWLLEGKAIPFDEHLHPRDDHGRWAHSHTISTDALTAPEQRDYWDGEEAPFRAPPGFEPWTKGHFGKGFLVSGEPFMWNVSTPDLSPHHDAAEEALLRKYHVEMDPDSRILIDPLGRYAYSDEERAKENAAFDRASMPEGEEWYVDEPTFPDLGNGLKRMPYAQWDAAAWELITDRHPNLKAFRWDEHQHPRDWEGRFARIPRAGGPLYHVAPRSERAKIEREGLHPHEPTAEAWNDPLVSGQPRGVYMFRDQQEADYWAWENLGEGNYDVWEVDAEDLPVTPDERMAYPSVRATSRIRPSKLYRVRGEEEVDEPAGAEHTLDAPVPAEIDYAKLAREQTAEIDAQLALAREGFTVPKLSEGDVAEIQEYTESFAVNGLLRRGEALDQPGTYGYVEQVAAMDRALAQAHAKQDTTVYRGVEGAVLPTSGTFTDKGYVSTSLDRGTAWDFGGGAGEQQIATIHIPAGAPAMATDGVPGLDTWGQAEVILPRDAVFTVTGTREAHSTDEWGYPKTVTFIDLDYVPRHA